MTGPGSAADLWATYEGNVQAYRQLSLATQGLFLAVGAILLEGERWLPFTAVLLLAMAAMWWVFFPVIFARTAIVDFHKFDLGNRYDADGGPAADDTTVFLREKDYAHVTNWALRRRVYAAETAGRRATHPAAPAFRTVRLTRVKLDVVMPVMLTAVWIAFAISAASS